MLRRTTPLLAGAIALCPAAFVSAATIFSDDFATAASSASYNTFITAGASAGPSGDATFGYDYSAQLGIPAAPHTTDGSTTGLRLRTDNLQNASAASVVGATMIATKTLSLPSQYVVSVDVWSNYIGGTSIAASGSNGTTGVAMGIGTTGTSIQYIVANNGLLFEGFGDNGAGANQAYRVYTNNNHPNPTTKGYWAAGTGASSASFSDPYYNFLTSHTAPSAQTTASPSTQGGSTPVGVLGFAWHTMTITEDGTQAIWAIDGHTIATVPNSDFTTAGSQISLGNDDTGTSGNSTAINQLLNAEIFDNLTVTPEPASLGLIGLGSMVFGVRRRVRR